MYAQNPMFSGVSPGRMAEARRFAQGGQMGRAKQQFELGGGQWNPQVHQGLRQQDNIGQMIPGPGPGGGPPPGIGGGGGNTNWDPTPGTPKYGGGPGGPPPDTWNPGGSPQIRQPGFEPGGSDDPSMGGSGYNTRPGRSPIGGPGGSPWQSFPGFGGGMGGGMGGMGGMGM